MACRNMEKGEEARREIVQETKNDAIFVQELDLASFDSIQKFAKRFNESKQAFQVAHFISTTGHFFIRIVYLKFKFIVFVPQEVSSEKLYRKEN